MPRYYFHVLSAVNAKDDEGIELPDLEAAKASSVVSARALVLDEMKGANRFSPNHSIQITDAAGVPLHVTRYGDCFDVRL